MCGICGIVDFSDPPSKDILRNMVRSIRHRGPDDDGVEIIGPAGLGHARLSIIDLTQHGHQPMLSADGQLALTYNGELYNYRELREQLQQEGAVFHSNSDTEVVLQAYCYWGCRAFERFNGMFGLAIWDQNKETLYLVRDRFGIKPLCYTATDNNIVFASEIKAILHSRRLQRELNLAALHEYMWYGYALGDNSFFAGVNKLLPGHYLSFSKQGISKTAYWSIAQVKEHDEGVAAATNNVREKLEQAVIDHLASDVPVGVFLSGGIDSSAITAFASKHYGGSLQTFSAGFDFAGGVNELGNAKKIADKFNTDHNEIHISGADLPSILESLVCAHDEPFADAANIPLYLLSKELDGKIKVILQGDGGDEIFAGYRRYNVIKHEWFWRMAARFSPLLQAIMPRNANYYRWDRFFSLMRQKDPITRTALMLTVENINCSPLAIFSDEFKRPMLEMNPFNYYRLLYPGLKNLDSVQRLLYTDCCIHLPNCFLEKVDKPTMAHSIEVRVPFLDKNLTDYVLGLPANYKIRRGHKKWILRRALRGILPDEILDGPKTGFGVPFQYWLRGPLYSYMREVIMSSRLIDEGVLNRAVLERCMQDHVTQKRDYGFLLWKTLILALWWHEYYDI